MRRAAVAVALAALTLCAGCNALGGERADDGPAVAVTPAAVPPPELPGVEDGEVVDAERVARAHEANVDARAYELVRTRTVRVVSTNRTLNAVRMRMRVAESGRAYDVSRVETSEAGYGTGGASTARVDVYFRNGTALQRTVGDGGTRVWRTNPAGGAGPVRDLSRAPFVGEVLAAFRPSVVERTRTDDGWRYRLRADGLTAPARLPTIPTAGNVTAANLSVTVDGRGVVRSLRYDYRTTYRGQQVGVTQTLTVGPTDDAVERPPWAPNEDDTVSR